MNENWKNEPTETSVVAWGDESGEFRMAARDGGLWYLAGRSFGRTWPELLAYIDRWGNGTPPRIVNLAEPEPEPDRVVVWETGDDLDKLLPYAGKEGVEVRAEMDGTVVTGPLGPATSPGMLLHAGVLSLIPSSWDITVTTPKPVAPWWQVDHIEEGHIVSWTDSMDVETFAFVWSDTWDLARRRADWDSYATPDTWRVTDVHAVGGPKLIAGVGSMRARDIERYDRKLAKITYARELGADHLGTVVTAKVVGCDEPVTGTLTSVTQRFGMGIFGPSVYTVVTLCPTCVDTQTPGTCEPLEGLSVVWLDEVRRNNAGLNDARQA